MIEQAAMTRNSNGTLAALVDEGFVTLLVGIAMVILLPLLAPLLLFRYLWLEVKRMRQKDAVMDEDASFWD
jgi:hypothetical protein